VKGASESSEWLEADGLGGFASGTLPGVRTRRYHALLLSATKPPTGRLVLVNGFDAWVETEKGRYALTSQRYSSGATDPDGASRLESFGDEPWPRWSFRLEDGTEVEQEVFVPHGMPAVALSWRIVGKPKAATLTVRPFLSGRDYHSLHHENPNFRFEPEIEGDRVTWRPYDSLPSVSALANGGYFHEPYWYRNFLYEEERARGLDHLEDLASPGVFRFDLERGEAVLVFSTLAPREASAGRLIASLREGEKERRGSFPSRLARAASAYVVARGEGRTIIAGYPWFTDWGRDTFIALRGLCLATGRLDDARRILAQWSGCVSEGMLPNRFPDRAEEPPEFNSVDASLWFVVAVHEYLAMATSRAGASKMEKAALAILDGFARGTRHGIRQDEDGLLACGEPGAQLTWMDAKVGDFVVTPRVGKPVEVQALWVNALRIGAAIDERWRSDAGRAEGAFRERFWNEEAGFLYDVVDRDHERGAVDAALRPNQILAVGGLPFRLVAGERARKIVDVVEERLLTPLGLRTLAPDDPSYRPIYEGGPGERDAAYHQGTVWPWLLGAFVDAWVGVRGAAKAVREEARARFLGPLLNHLEEAGRGHISEIADGAAPHTPRGCPFQAWSVGEALRIEALLGGKVTPKTGRNRRRSHASKGQIEQAPSPGPAARPHDSLGRGRL
jgi:predicted glycogen debranching enzyme